MSFKLIQDLLQKHETNGFSVGDNISKKKLKNAISHFPINKELDVLGLIDCTVMGSNKNGLAITEKGLIWNNGWASDTIKKHLTWSELSELKRDMGIKLFDVNFNEKIQFSLAGSSMKVTDAFHLFIDLIALYDDFVLNNSADNDQQLTGVEIQPETKKHTEEEQINYEEILIISLALMTAADGKVDEEEVDLVAAFLEEEDSIHDKNIALTSYREHISTLESSYKKSESLFKLQTTKLLKKVVNLDNKALTEELEIMLEGMIDAAGGRENKQTVNMMMMIMEKQTPLTKNRKILVLDKSSPRDEMKSSSDPEITSVSLENTSETTQEQSQSMFKKLKGNVESVANTAKETASNVADRASEVIPDDVIDIKDKIKKSSLEISEKVEGYIPEEVIDRINEAKNTVGDTIDDLSDKAGDYLNSKLEEIESYCSWCFEKHGCTPQEKNNFSRNIYTCNGCGKEIVKCRACNNKAKFAGEENTEKGNKVGIWSGNFCAVHEGTIAKFETLNWKLSSIGEYRDIVEREELNYKKIGTTAAFTIGGAAVIAPLALAAAPAIGGALGTSLLGYSGAAATNAGLATLGGGALAAGGAGMAGGVAVVTAAGTALGGRYGAVISNSYYGDIDGFEIIKIRPGKGPSVICVDGFLTEKIKEVPSQWLSTLENIYPENEIYYVKWESKRLQDIANSISFVGGKEVAKKGIMNLAKSASKTAATKLAPLGVAFQTLGLATNPWSVAGVKAYQTGALLADIIARTDKEYILIGHSLGARVIYSCLASLKTKDETFIKDVHLLGGAVNNNCTSNKDCSDSVNWSGTEDAVSGSIYNYFSEKDDVLNILYPLGEAVKLEFGDPIGRHSINNSKINNIDVSDHVSGHTKYKGKMESFLNV